MFSDEITGSDAFLDMPDSSQNLYFQLGMNADDDGFIGNPKTVMRATGKKEDDYKLLVAKRFVIPFVSGVCVIKHWRINNQIRKDRYKETRYLEEKGQLFIKENGGYTQNPDKGLPIPKGHFIPANADERESGNQLATNWQPSISKVSIGKDSRDNTMGDEGVEKAPEKYSESFEKFYKAFPPRRKGGKKAPWLKWKALSLLDQTLILEDVPKRTLEHWDWIKDEGNYIPAPEVYLNKQQWLMPIASAPKITRPVEQVDRFLPN